MNQATENAVYQLLDRLGINYEVLHHEAAFTMEICQGIEQELGAPICKNLFLCNRQQTDFYLLLMPGDKVFKTKYLSSQLGCARLSFAGEEFMRSLLHILPGSVSPMGLMNDTEGRVRLIIDRDLLGKDTPTNGDTPTDGDTPADGDAVASDTYFGCHPCVNTATLRLSMREFLTKFLPAVGHEYTLVDLPAE